MLPLTDFCASDQDEWRRPDWMHAPFKLGPWRVATNGHWMVAESGDTTDLPVYPANNPEQFMRWLNQDAPTRIVATALREWAGVYEPNRGSLPCVNCSAKHCIAETHSKRGECPNCCSRCDNEGSYFEHAPSRPGTLLGLVVNRNFLAHVLDAFASDTEVFQYAAVSSETMLIGAGNRRALLMGLKGVPSESTFGEKIPDVVQRVFRP